MARKTTPENIVTKAVKELLVMHSYKVYKIYNGALPIRTREGKIVYKRKDPEEKGVPDILAIKPNKWQLWVEVKAGKNKMTPEQEQFLIDLQGIPNVYGMFVNEKRLDMFEKFLKGLGENDDA